MLTKITFNASGNALTKLLKYFLETLLIPQEILFSSGRKSVEYSSDTLYSFKPFIQ